jgi:hypothetical protein
MRHCFVILTINYVITCRVGMSMKASAFLKTVNNNSYLAVGIRVLLLLSLKLIRG